MTDPMPDPMPDSITTLRTQLVQLRQSRAAGTLDATTYDALKAPLERLLVDAVLDAGVPLQNPAAMPAAMSPATPPATPVPVRSTRPVLTGSVAFIALVALAGYLWTGSPGAIGQPPAAFTQGGGPATAAAATGDGTAPVSREQIEAMVVRLAERLKAQPDDADGWVMLGRSYMALEKPADASKAYQVAIKQRPNDASLLADAADATAAGSPNGLEGEPMRLIERALQIDPANLKALALAGSAAFNRGDYAGAAERWDRVVAIGPPESKLVELARGGAAEARQRARSPVAIDAKPAAKPAAEPAAELTAKSAAVPAGASITGTVRLAPALAALAAPGDTVFIYARAAEGGRMPLAIVRKQVADLPFDFVLDDSSAMSPAARLSGANQVVISARISKSGQAVPQSGDLEATSPPVVVGARGLTLEISQRIP